MECATTTGRSTPISARPARTSSACRTGEDSNRSRTLKPCPGRSGAHTPNRGFSRSNNAIRMSSAVVSAPWISTTGGPSPALSTRSVRRPSSRIVAAPASTAGAAALNGR